jgi:flagellar hook-basal body complex protein FliE
MAVDRIGALTQRMVQMGTAGPLGGLGGAGGIRGVGDTGGIQVPAGAGGSGPSFGDTLKHFVNDVSAQQDAAGELRDKFVRGEGVELHQVMAAGEEAGIALELMIELRNKVTEAYRTLVSMQ